MDNKTLKRLSVITLSTAAAVSFTGEDTVFADQSDESVFSDVDKSDYYYEAVYALVDMGVLTGYDDGTFRPKNDITRAEAANMFAKSLGLDMENATNPGFTDVKEGKWYYGAVSALANAKILNGYEDGTFKPEQTITRAEMAKMIAVSYNLVDMEGELDKFEDVEDGDWFKDYVEILAENEVTQGQTATEFAPGENVTRGQAATFLYRSEQLISSLLLDNEYAVAMNGEASVSERFTGNGSFTNVADKKAEFYIDPLQIEGIGEIKLSEIDSISYASKKEDETKALDFALEIYTVGDKHGWYEERLSSEPMYANEYNANEGQWNTWNTDTGENQLVFYDSNHGPAGFNNGPTLQDLESKPIDWSNYGGEPGAINYASQTVKYFKLQTGSGWTDFKGYVDRLVITLKNGAVFEIDMEPSHAPSGVTAQDHDDEGTGVNGLDFTVNWTASAWTEADHQEIYILPENTTFDLEQQTAVAEIEDSTTETWTGTEDLTKDSIGASLGSVDYDVYVVSYNEDGSEYYVSEVVTFTPESD
ncbi:S-layer homology domain-containing protein [Bacillus sp. Marseille-Q3570]|uniref:S-layer homology domain-containing protein n=1 Tax=Bacillus sp. Marseille-Q3570 TaxID=2963522 RepID=UPI0021B7BA0A|nr:S-layer homology domain-containing protein [Bacillus sp. Marseille-Q3570]